MMRDDLGDAYRKARKSLAGNDASVQQNLWLASGFLLGAGMVHAAAALETAFRIAYPEAEFPEIR